MDDVFGYDSWGDLCFDNYRSPEELLETTMFHREPVIQALPEPEIMPVKIKKTHRRLTKVQKLQII